MYSLPQEYWDEEILKEIGNTLGSYVRTPDQTNLNKYTSYAKICVYIHIAKSLPYAICLMHEYSDRIQPLDYEHVPFICHKFYNMTTCTDTSLWKEHAWKIRKGMEKMLKDSRKWGKNTQ